MIIIYYTRQILPSGSKQPDFAKVNTVEEFVDWFSSLGDRIMFNLVKKNRSLTPEGWEKSLAHSANVMQAYNTDQKMALTINKIVSDEGILFEDIKYCSEQIVDQMALKCVIK
jgi:hypothetical protein